MLNDIYRDNTGKILITGIVEATFAPTAVIVEALEIRLAVKLAQNLAMEDVIVEPDCLPVIEARRGSITRLDLQLIISDINFFKDQISKCGFTWTGRDGNQVAHEMARLALTNQLPSNWVFAPPLSL